MTPASPDTLREHVAELAHEARWDEIAELLAGIHPNDLAELITGLSPDYRERVFNLIEDAIKPDVLAELEGRAGKEVLQSLTNAELAELVEEMAPDDAADVIADLSDERGERVLDLMEKEESRDVRELLKYDEETAGGIMTTDVVAFKDSLTVAETIERIAYIDQDEPFYYAYVVDDQGRLVGYIGLWELLKVRRRDLKLGEVAHRDVIAATTDMDQEKVAQLMSKYDLTALPVTDSAGRLVGRITADDVMDVIEEEASEDILRLAGSDDIELFQTSPWQACRVRLPWLMVTLMTGFVTSTLLKHFMLNLSEVIALSFFVPIVMAMGGNTGIQSSTLIVRSIALGTIEGRSVLRILLREVTVAAIMGIFCGAVIALWAKILIGHDPNPAYPAAFLAITVATALFVAMTFGAFFGAFVPMLLHRLHVDPAVASGPFVTSSNDIFALLLYHSVAIIMLVVYHYAHGAAA